MDSGSRRTPGSLQGEEVGPKTSDSLKEPFLKGTIYKRQAVDQIRPKDRLVA